MKLELKIDGIQTVLDGLKAAAEKYPAAVGAALYEEGLKIDAASVDLVPVDKGRLKGTHYTSPPVMGDDGPEVEVGYGTDYAVPVHERTAVHHDVGQAKYLEKPLTDAASGFAERVAKRTEKHIESATPFAVLPAAPKGG
jgi:hypothetical protein